MADLSSPLSYATGHRMDHHLLCTDEAEEALKALEYYRAKCIVKQKEKKKHTHTHFFSTPSL
jgi:hypothetical protein